MKSMSWYLNRRLLAAVALGIGSFLRTASDPDPKVRRQRYLRLVGPILPEVIARLAVGFSSEEGEPPRGSVSCLPFYLSPLAFVAYTLFLRSRIGSGREIKNALMWRRLSAVLAAVGAYLRASSHPRAYFRIAWPMIAAPLVSEVVEEAAETRNLRLARGLAGATTAGLALATLILGRRELREGE